MLSIRQTALTWVLIMILLCCSAALSSAAQEESPSSSVAIILSRKIRPYLEALDGVRAFFSKKEAITLRTVFLPDYSEKEGQQLISGLLSAGHDLVLTIGPEAARYISGSAVDHSRLPVLYSMILNPRKIVGREACHLALNIPVSVQLSHIKRYLPEAVKIGLIYDPALNRDFYGRARRAAADTGLTIVDLKVRERKDITGVINEYWPKIDALWFIPDRTVISPSIVRYIIKEALVHHKPVIGYNRFFVRSGAVMSFVFDYRQIGRQSALLAEGILAGRKCRSRPPVFEVRINEKVAERLELEVEVDGGEKAGQIP